MRRHNLVIAASAAVTAALAAAFTWRISGLASHRPDFAMTWQAVQLANPYDRAALVSALHWESRYPVAFVYPPTAMPLFALLGLLPMRVALALWAAISGAALAVASRSKWAALLLLTPSLLWAIPGGQTSVLLGAMLLGSLLLLKKRVASGLLLGAALALKPQLAITFPILLLLARRWEVLIAMALTYGAAGAVSALLFGPGAWIEWAQAVPGFVGLHESTNVLSRNEIAFGLPLWLRIVSAVAGAWLAAIALRAGRTVEAFAIASCAAMVGSPHAMGYEFAMLAPAAPALFARREWSAAAIFLFLMTPGFIWFGLPPHPFRLIAVLLLVTALSIDALLPKRRADEAGRAQLESASVT